MASFVKLRERALPLGLLVPTLAALALALGYPLVRQVVLSFQDFGLAQQFGKPPTWVGLQNYRDLVTDAYLWRLLARSIAFCLVNAALTIVIGVGVAIVMQKMSSFIRLAAQSALLLAWAMPVVAAMMVFQFLFDTEFGVINWTLTHLGLDYTNHPWLLNPWSFYFVATVIIVWMSVPFVVFTTYAALTQVPDELIEAAEIDGANAAQRFGNIVWPTIRPVLTIVLLLEVIWDLRVFTQIYTLQRAGGVAEKTNLIGTYIYRLGISSAHFGVAAAVAMFMLVITVILTAPYIRIMFKQEAES